MTAVDNARTFSPRARKLAGGVCDGCGYKPHFSPQLGRTPDLIVLPIIDGRNANGWPGFFDPTINALVLCHACSRATTSPSAKVSMKLGMARRAWQAWKTFDRIPDHKQLPGTERCT